MNFFDYYIYLFDYFENSFFKNSKPQIKCLCGKLVGISKMQKNFL